MEGNKPKILIAGESLAHISGLAYVSTSFMRLFKNAGYEVAYVVLSGDSSTSSDLSKFHTDYKDQEEVDAKKIPVFNAQFHSEKTSNLINDVILHYSPDVVISFLDPWKLDQLAYTAYRHKFFWVVYTTIEVPRYSEYVMYPTPVKPVIRKSIKATLEKADMIIPVTDMAKKALELFNLKPTEHIYNGIDFSEVQNPDNFKKEDVFKGVVNENSYIVMTMGLNSERKQLGKVVEAYDKFLTKIGRPENVKLYIHTNTDEQKNGPDLVTMLIDRDLTRNVILPLDLAKGGQDTKYKLYRKYSICDCYIGLPMGEGFGYGFAEAMAHKKPVVYLDYGGHADYLKNIGLPVKVKDYIYMAHSNIKFAIPDTDDAAKQLAKLYSTPKLRASMGEKGYEYAKTDFDWNIVFKKLLDKIIPTYSEYQKNRTILSKVNAKKLI